MKKGEWRTYTQMNLILFWDISFKDIKKKNGSNYEPNSLTSFHRSFGRYLRLKKVPFGILFDKEFLTSRSTLAARRKELRSYGKGQKANASKCITSSDEDKFFTSGQMGRQSPEALIRTIWYFLTLHMGMQGRDEHCKLRYGDFALKTDEDGTYRVC